MGFTHHRWCWLAAISRTSSADASLFRTRTTTIPGARHILQPPSSFSRAHFIKFSSIVHQSSTLSRLCFRHFIYNSLTTIWHYFHIHLLPDHQVEDLCQDACTAATFNGTEMLLTVSQFYPARLLLSRALTLPFFFFAAVPKPSYRFPCIGIVHGVSTMTIETPSAPMFATWSASWLCF